MASAQLRSVIEALRANPIQGNTVPELRASMEAFGAGLALPGDVRFEPVLANGVPAEWTVAPGARDDRAIVYFHGGGYAIGSIATHRPLLARLSRAARLRVLSVDYRLGPEHRHPAAVEDAVAAYRFALDAGIRPSNLALGGDSAGGGLTLVSLIAIRDRGLPLPAAGVGISPWTDLTLSGESMKTKIQDDPIVTEAVLRMVRQAYLGDSDPSAPLVSPLFADLRGLPPLLVQVGSAEVLLDDAVRFAKAAAKAGVSIELRVWEDMIHVWHNLADVLPEAVAAIDEIAAFLERRMGA